VLNLALTPVLCTHFIIRSEANVDELQGPARRLEMAQTLSLSLSPTSWSNFLRPKFVTLFSPIAFWEITDHGAFSYRVGKPKFVDSPVYGIAVIRYENGKR
jgi:hypothetical protein